MSSYKFISRKRECEYVTSFIWWDSYSSSQYGRKYFQIGLYCKVYGYHLMLGLRLRRIKGVDKPIKLIPCYYKWTDKDAEASEKWMRGE